MFDRFTTGLVVAAACLLGGLIMLVLRLRDRNPAYSWWVAGFTLFGLGVVLGRLKPYLGPLAVPLPALIALFGVGALWAGLRAFEQRPFPFLAVLPPAIWLIGLTLVEPTYALKPFVFNLAIGTGTLLIGADIMRTAKRPFSARSCIGIVCLIETLISYSQAVALFTLRNEIGDGPLTGWMTFAPFQTGIAMIAIVLFGILMISEVSHRRLHRLATTDPLSDALNRRGFFEKGTAALGPHEKASRAAVVVFDIDHFKRINDAYGHPAGDRVIAEFAARARDQLRPGDIFGRLGGEEFALLLPRMNREEAALIADRIRAVLSATPIQYGDHAISVTASAGLAAAPRDGTDLDRLIAMADAALYTAKQNGRNRTALHQKEPVQLHHLTSPARTG
ncbi:diguanylate cyclase [Methyloligella sp. 2.7D]|uniref:GGDEF domain-containing protein n=1 Tax=unclassified Methyloligella TaxID=2625955 RepID=UPI00157CCBB9|nr:GGDEF domain-containing protein [Methyloligella sp. GL2]QKP77147.1 GGDEF domain-containing protein [Methyloligella sp. GL2]